MNNEAIVLLKEILALCEDRLDATCPGGEKLSDVFAKLEEIITSTSKKKF